MGLSVSNQVKDVEGLEVAIVQYIKGILGKPDLPVGQHFEGTQLKCEHIRFQVLSMDGEEFGCDSYDCDIDGNAFVCSIEEFQVVVQIDAMYCPDSMELILKLAKAFKSPSHKKHGNYENFAYKGNSSIRHVPFVMDNKKHHKTTFDVTFAWKCEYCRSVDQINITLIRACEHMEIESFEIDRLNLPEQ